MACRIWSFVVVALLFAPALLRADTFDRYVNPVLARVPGGDGVQEIQQLTLSQIAANDRVLPDAAGAFVVVKTNEGRFAKLLVQAARQKIGTSSVPIFILERYSTYKEGEERAIQASGQNVHLFEGFHFHLDFGQVVPASLGGDLRLALDGTKATLMPVGRAKLYLVTKPLPPSSKDAVPVVTEPFVPRYLNGRYKLHDDGRRSGTLVLQVAETGDVSGHFFSDKDGRKYELFGKIGAAKHALQFTIKFPQTEQVFQGWMFTGDGKAIAGYARMQERETGFYAVRIEGD